MRRIDTGFQSSRTSGEGREKNCRHTLRSGPGKKRNGEDMCRACVCTSVAFDKVSSKLDKRQRKNKRIERGREKLHLGSGAAVKFMPGLRGKKKRAKERVRERLCPFLFV